MDGTGASVVAGGGSTGAGATAGSGTAAGAGCSASAAVGSDGTTIGTIGGDWPIGFTVRPMMFTVATTMITAETAMIVPWIHRVRRPAGAVGSAIVVPQRFGPQCPIRIVVGPALAANPSIGQGAPTPGTDSEIVGELLGREEHIFVQP